VLGLGLLGGSVALAARERGIARELVGSARRRAPLEAALRAGVIDAIEEPLAAVRGADLVVLATPVAAMPGVLEEVASALAAGTIVTDVGSVKADLANTLPGLLPKGVHYVGSHPMAGSHEVGVEHANAKLFEGAICVVTSVAETNDVARGRIEAFWAALGARVERRTPEVHDAQVAWTSHLPHLLAFAFAGALEHAPAAAGPLAATGFDDFTRIARSDKDVWADILSSNCAALAGPIRRFSEALEELARAVEADDSADLKQLLASARDTLVEVADKAAQTPAVVPARDEQEARSGGSNPEIQAAPKRAADSKR
jgi:prephenate dehydrogenase